MHLTVEPHPLLDLRAFVTTFPKPLGELESSAELMAMLALDAEAPLSSDDQVKDAVRKMLRYGGFKPSGRSKPASEYLRRAVGDNALSSINPAVDTCNVVSLHSGLPISVVDLDLTKEPYRVAVATKEDSYVFNTAGQIIDVGGLLCLFDGEGASGNAVKDSQRTKTSERTVRTLTLIWGSVDQPGRAEQTGKWYRELLEAQGATTETCPTISDT